MQFRSGWALHLGQVRLIGLTGSCSGSFGMRSRYPAQSQLRLVVLLDDLLDEVEQLFGVLLFQGLPCECAPLFFCGFVSGMNRLRNLLDRLYRNLFEVCF
jgi:hypothetical protein